MPTDQPKSRFGLVPFLAAQLVLVGGLAGAAVWRSRELPRGPQIPALRETPLVVKPLYDNPLVVTDEQLARVLPRLRPRLVGKETKIGGMDHALRFWTADAKFDDPQFIDGEDIRRLLTDHRQFVALYGESEKPLLIPEKSGVRVRTQEGQATSTHFDHTLACLAEVGTPLSYPVHTPAGDTTVRAILEHALRDFSLNQFEYEWSAQVFALYMEPTDAWFTKEGQRVTFDIIAQRIMRERMPRGVCYGNHRIYTLAALLQIDEQNQLFSPAVRKEIIAYLTGLTAILIKNQHADGYWGPDWSRQEGDPEPDNEGVDDLVGRQILATGHVLEWWAIAPAECQPPRENLIRASQWLVKTIDAQTDAEIASRYTFLTHAGRALCLWRKFDPAQIH
jgi:hypothetical protein